MGSGSLKKEPTSTRKPRRFYELQHLFLHMLAKNQSPISYLLKFCRALAQTNKFKHECQHVHASLRVWRHTLLMHLQAQTSRTAERGVKSNFVPCRGAKGHETTHSSCTQAWGFSNYVVCCILCEEFYRRILSLFFFRAQENGCFG